MGKDIEIVAGARLGTEADTLVRRSACARQTHARTGLHT